MHSQRDDAPTIPREILAYYERFAEESRLASGPSRFEFERTKDIVARVLPDSPAVILDVGGAAGAYASWLAALGHEVHLICRGDFGAFGHSSAFTPVCRTNNTAAADNTNFRIATSRKGENQAPNR
jgi:hypothetical protein